LALAFAGAAMRTLASPDPEAAVAFLRGSLHRDLVQVVGLCEVRYQGRAQSSLSLGERLILLKPDGTLLVHTATRIKPVNWQPPGAAFAASLEEGVVVLTSKRDGKGGEPEEVVRIALHDVQALLAVRLKDDESLALLGSELDLARLVHKRPDLVEAGFRVSAGERDNGRGPMDVVGLDAQGRRVVVELKRKAAGLKEAEQLRRYVERERAAKGQVRGILMAPAVSDQARRYLAELGCEVRLVDWEKVLPLLQRVLPAGQRSLASWDGDGSNGAPAPP
jgi:endonuclease